MTGNGRNVNTDAPVQPLPQDTELLLGLVEVEKFLPGRLTDSCVVSAVCGDHSGLNGFTESVGREEPVTVGLGGAAAVHGHISAQTGGQMRQEPAGVSTVDTPDSDLCSAGGEAAPGGCARTSVSAEQPWTVEHQQNRGALPCPDVNMSNGDITGPGSSAVHCKQTGPIRDHRLGLCDVEGKVANGGLHIGKPATGDRDHPDHTEGRSDRGPTHEPGRGLGVPQMDPGVRGRGSASQCPAEDVPAAEEPPPPCTPTVCDSPTAGSSAKLPPPRTLPLPDLNGDLPGYDTDLGDSDEDVADLRCPVRPQTLRTNPTLSVSLSCDATPLSPDDEGGFYFGDGSYEDDLRTVLDAGRRQSAPDKLQDVDGQTDGSDPRLMPKRFGIADFFTRSLFSRKPKEPKVPSHNATGWRLFGKAAARESDATKDMLDSSAQQEEQMRDILSSCPQCPPSAGRRKNLEFEPLSTTALILEDRPANLPAKSVEETQRHKLEYEEMVAGAKRRELKEAQKKKRQMKERHRQEDIISNAMVIWNNEILPHWDTMKGTRRVRELWWAGLPPSVRGRVWSLAIGNELNITAELYEIFLSRAKEKWRSYSETSSVNDSESDGGASLADRESSLDLIKLDISRTFPSLFIFQKGGPYHDLLHSVLGAYTCYRPDIGYVQGMSFIAAVLILNLEEAEAFITFANLLNKPCQMAFFRVDHELMLKYFSAFEVFFEENLPHLFNHFQTNSLTPDLYLIDWIFTLYSKSLPLDVACRVWDVFCRDGEESLFRTGLGILRLYEDVLLQMDFIHIAQFLSRLPEDLQSHTLFNAMANTHMVSRNRRWAQVFSALMKDGNKETDKNSSPALRS